MQTVVPWEQCMEPCSYYRSSTYKWNGTSQVCETRVQGVTPMMKIHIIYCPEQVQKNELEEAKGNKIVENKHVQTQKTWTTTKNKISSYRSNHTRDHVCSRDRFDRAGSLCSVQ